MMVSILSLILSCVRSCKPSYSCAGRFGHRSFWSFSHPFSFALSFRESIRGALVALFVSCTCLYNATLVCSEEGDLAGIRQISAGKNHTCAVSTEGGVACWGLNSHGQLGNGSFENSSRPVTAKLQTGVLSVVAGGDESCVLTTNGKLRCWGRNSSGQLGDGTTENRNTPVEVLGLDGAVIQVAIGDGFVCALVSGGDVWCWGRNELGQLGNSTNQSSFVPVQVQGTGERAVSLALGENHACVLLQGGGVKCWGGNEAGQIGLKKDVSRNKAALVSNWQQGVLMIAAGSGFTCALIENGNISCLGKNTDGQLGDGTTEERDTPSAVKMPTEDRIVGGRQFAAKGSSFCVLDNLGMLFCWGNNSYGQLGNNDFGNRSLPQKINVTLGGISSVVLGDGHSCILTALGKVVCFGKNTFGQRGIGITSSEMQPQVVLGLNRPTKNLAAGMYHTCSVSAGGDVQCWGYNFYGQLGDGTSYNRYYPVTVRNLGAVRELVAGVHHTCGLTEGGGVKCWGWNFFGQLGDGTTENRAEVVDVHSLQRGVVAIGAGSYHTCAVLTGGEIKCWGWNGESQIGSASREFESRSVDEAANGYKERLVRTPVALRELTDKTASVSGGLHHSCAVLESGSVKCWGGNGSGQLGNGNKEVHGIPVDVLDSASVREVVSGVLHSCFEYMAGGVKCWGRNAMGELGDGTNDNKDRPVVVDGLEKNWRGISAGGYHTCAVSTLGSLACWGMNSHGQLGNGLISDANKPVAVESLKMSVEKVIAGGYHTCALLRSGEVVCWGDNEFGQIAKSRQGAQAVMGVKAE